MLADYEPKYPRTRAYFPSESFLVTPRVRISLAPPSSLRVEAFSEDERKLRARSGDARAPSAPENAEMVSPTASLRSSLCGRIVRCRCLLLANTTSGHELRTSQNDAKGTSSFWRRKRVPEHRLLMRHHTN